MALCRHGSALRLHAYGFCVIFARSCRGAKIVPVALVFGSYKCKGCSFAVMNTIMLVLEFIAHVFEPCHGVFFRLLGSQQKIAPRHKSHGFACVPCRLSCMIVYRRSEYGTHEEGQRS